MNLIQRELETGNDPRILSLLDHHKPNDGERDLRSFEWYYAWGLCNRNPWTWRHHASVNSIAYSPNGKYVALGCSDGRIQVSDAATGKVITALHGHADVVTDIEFSPGGELIASSSRDSKAKLWRLKSGRLDPTGDVLHSQGAVTCMAFSPDGTVLAIGSDVDEIGALKLWNLKTNAQRDIDAHSARVYGIAFSSDGASLALASNRTITVYDTTTAQVTKKIETGLPPLSALAWSPMSDALAWGSTSGAIEIWDHETGRQRLGQHVTWISDLVFSADGQTLASAGRDYLVKLWDVKRRETTHVLRGHLAEVRSIAFSPDGRTLVSASADHSTKLWNLARNHATYRLASHEGPVCAVAFSQADRKALVSGSTVGAVKLWDTDEAELTATLPSYGATIRCVAISPNGKTIAYAGGPDDQPAELFLWDAERKTVRRTPREHSRAILAAAFSPDGETVATAGYDGLLMLWDVATGTHKAKLDSNTQAIVSVAYSPNGKWLATAIFQQNEITLWDLDTPGERRVLAGHEDSVNSVAFSPDSSFLASGGREQTIKIWDVAMGTEKSTLGGHSGHVESVTFSPDGATLASVGRDDRLRLWDMATGQEKANLSCRLEMTAGLAVAFSQDGRTLAAASGDSVVLHRAATDEDFFFHEEPEVPRNHHLSTGVAKASPVVLEAIPFFHRHSDVTHLSSHWQVRTADGSYAVPVVNHVSMRDLTTLSVEHGVLSPNLTYFFRVAYTGSNRKTTPFSSETSFTTSDFPMKAVSFDLTSQANRDIVKNPGDSETDSIDLGVGSHLVVDGFDGTATDNARVNGLPSNRSVGVHVLADYSSNNAIQTGLTDEDKTPIRVSVPPDGYDFVRFLVVGGNGNSDMPIRFVYEDGTTQREIVRCDDWFHDITENRYGMLRRGLLPIVNEMDRFYKDKFHNADAAAVFEFTVRLDGTKKLLAFELETDSDDVLYTDTALWPNHGRARFNLLAATGVTVDP